MKKINKWNNKYTKTLTGFHLHGSLSEELPCMTSNHSPLYQGENIVQNFSCIWFVFKHLLNKNYERKYCSGERHFISGLMLIKILKGVGMWREVTEERKRTDEEEVKNKKKKGRLPCGKDKSLLNVYIKSFRVSHLI